MDKRTKNFMVVALLAVMFVSELNTIAAVIMADLVKLFPDASMTAIQMVMQFGMIGTFPVTLCIGFFTNKFRIKPMICIGLCLILVGGLLPLAFHSSLGQLYLSAIMIGMGQGFMAPLVSTLTLRHFENKPRERQIGFNAASSSAGAALFTVLAGVLALSGWLNIYFLYFFAVPALILVIVFMPLGEKPVPVPQEKKEKTPVPARAFVLALFLIMMFIGYVAFPLNIGILVDAEGIGDSASTGLAISVITIVGVVLGLVFPFIVKVVKSFVGAFTCIFGVAGMAVVVVADSMAMIFVAAVLVGVFFGMAVAGSVYIVGRMCSPQQFAPALSIVLGLLYLGVILCPIVVNGITALWGGEGARAAFITSAGIMCVVTVAQFIWGIWIKKNFPEKAEGADSEAAAEALDATGTADAIATTENTVESAANTVDNSVENVENAADKLDQ